MINLATKSQLSIFSFITHSYLIEIGLFEVSNKIYEQTNQLNKRARTSNNYEKATRKTKRFHIQGAFNCSRMDCVYCVG